MADFKLCSIQTERLGAQFAACCGKERLIASCADGISVGEIDRVFAVTCDGAWILAICLPDTSSVVSATASIKELKTYADYHHLDECEIVYHEFPDGAAAICLKKDEDTFIELSHLHDVSLCIKDNPIPMMMNLPE